MSADYLKLMFTVSPLLCSTYQLLIPHTNTVYNLFTHRIYFIISSSYFSSEKDTDLAAGSAACSLIQLQIARQLFQNK